MAENTRVGQHHRVLVAGATGYLGGYVTAALRSHGYWVRVLARRASRHKLAAGSANETFLGEATKYESLKGVCDGVDVVFSSIGIRSLAPRPTFWDVDFKANMNLLRRAREAGVRHFIFVSVLHGNEVRAKTPIAEARERVVDALMDSDMAWTVIRPTGYFNDTSDLFQMVRRSGTYFVVGDGMARINPIHGADLAEQIVQSMDTRFHNQSLCFGGPDIFTFLGIGELAFETLGRNPRIVSVPPGLISIAANLIGPLDLNASAMLKAFGLLAEIDGVGTPVGTHHLRDFFKQLAATSRGR